MQPGERSGELQPEPVVDHRWGVDPRHDGLRKVPQRTWYWRTL